MKKIAWKDIGMSKLLLLLLAGVLLLILALPTPKEPKEPASETKAAAPQPLEEDSYVAGLEKKLALILESVDGVGKADVMITLKSSEERVVQVDKKTSDKSTKESDSAGGNREVIEKEVEEDTVFTNTSGSGSTPFVQKELKPEIAGVVVSAAGGASPAVKSEIIEAVQALFDVPSHKIKVLKRVE